MKSQLASPRPSYFKSAFFFVLVVSILLVLCISAWLLTMLGSHAVDRGYFHELIWLKQIPGPNTGADMGDKAAAGQFWGAVVGGLVAGGLTLIAAFVAVMGVVYEKRKETHRDFLAWIMDFNARFHQDEDYGVVRVSLIEHRNAFLRAMIEELDSIRAGHQDSLIGSIWKFLDESCKPQLPDKPDDRCPCYLHEGKYHIHWPFVRKLTDLLRFYEMVLMVAKRLPESDDYQRNFTGAFAWHVRAILWNWTEDSGGDAMAELKRRLFVLYYLKINNFNYLASVGNYLLSEYFEHLDQKNPEYDEISDMLEQFFSEVGGGMSKGSKRTRELSEIFFTPKQEWSHIFGKLL
jgi:hypothetical protein